MSDAMFVLIKKNRAMVQQGEETIIGFAHDMGVLLRWVKKHAPHHSNPSPSLSHDGWIFMAPPEMVISVAPPDYDYQHLYYIALAPVLTDSLEDV